MSNDTLEFLACFYEHIHIICTVMMELFLEIPLLLFTIILCLCCLVPFIEFFCFLFVHVFRPECFTWWEFTTIVFVFGCVPTMCKESLALLLQSKHIR